MNNSKRVKKSIFYDKNQIILEGIIKSDPKLLPDGVRYYFILLNNKKGGKVSYTCRITEFFFRQFKAWLKEGDRVRLIGTHHHRTFLKGKVRTTTQRVDVKSVYLLENEKNSKTFTKEQWEKMQEWEKKENKEKKQKDINDIEVFEKADDVEQKIIDNKIKINL